MTSGGAVAAGHPLTADAVLEVLDAGGSAADAAIAAAAAACVVEPVLASLGGGGFLLWDPADGEAAVYDFFVDTPLRPKPETELDFHAAVCDFGTTTQMFHIGRGAVAVPGMLSGLVELQRSLARLPMTELLRPARRFARDGFQLSELQAYILGIVEPIQAHSPALDNLFRTEEGHRLGAGDNLRQPELADTLDLLGREGLRPFQEGEPAAALLDLMKDGGHLGAEDLKAMRVRHRRPLRRRHAGAEVLTMPAPSSGGLLIAFALDLAAHLDLGGFGGPGHLIALSRIMTLTDRARQETGLADASGEAAEEAATRRLADPQLLQSYARKMSAAPQIVRGTTHISVVDGEGNLASVSLSNGEGCGYLLPGTGIHLNNMLGEEDLNPRGFHRWPAGVRMGSMMAPTTAVLADGRRVAIGSGGSNRLRGAILQVLLNLTDFRHSLSDAVAAPRLHVEKGIAHAEPGHSEAALNALDREVGNLQLWSAPNLYFGGVHAVAATPGRGFEAVGDPRRGGVGRLAKSRGG